MNFKSIIPAALMAITALSSCSGSSAKPATDDAAADSTKVLVCYFSATGNTATQADRLATLLGADTHEIVPIEHYTAEDLDYRNENSRSSLEMRDPQSRPAIVPSEVDIAKYDIVFLGYPNWWNTAPRIINTFIEAYKLEGKTIVPFMTSGSCDIENSENDLHQAYPDLTFAKGLLMNNVTDADIQAWVAPLGLTVTLPAPEE